MALMAARIWQWIGSVAVVVILLGVFVRLGYVVADGISEPFVVTAAQVMTPAVRTGEPISVIYTIDRRRLCTTTIAEFWIDRETNQAVFRNRVPGGYSPLGERRTLVTLRPPIPLPAGHYSYRSYMESDCGLTTFTFPVPDAEFDVVP